MPAMQTFAPQDRPKIQLQLEDGRWVQGDLHAWQARGDEQWASVVWHDAGSTWRETLPADRVRKLELTNELRAVAAFAERTFPDDQARDAALHAELQISPTRYQHQLAYLEQLRDTEPLR